MVLFLVVHKIIHHPNSSSSSSGKGRSYTVEALPPPPPPQLVSRTQDVAAVGGVLISREPRKDEINLDLVSLLNSLSFPRPSYKAFRLSELDHTPMTIICHF